MPEISFDTAEQLSAGLKMAFALWARREALLPECDVTADWEDQLDDIEARYRAMITALSPAVRRFPATLAPHLAQRRGPALDVACHLLLLARSTLRAELARVAADQEGRRYWRLCHMLRFCPDQDVEDACVLLAECGVPWLSDAMAEPIAGRGARQLAPLLSRAMISAQDGGVSTYVVEALGRLGVAEEAARITALMAAAGSQPGLHRATACARALQMLGATAGHAYYRDLVAQERGDAPDRALVLARFAGPEDADLLIERARSTTSPAWRVQLISALGVLGTPRSVPTLLEALSPTDRDLRVAAHEALATLTGEVIDLDVEEDGEEARELWSKIWHDIGHRFDPARRYEAGNPSSLQTLVDGLSGPLAESRARQHVELVIYTGQHIAFDAKAYLYAQREARQAWQRWLDARGEALQDGRYWRYGATLG